MRCQPLFLISLLTLLIATSQATAEVKTLSTRDELRLALSALRPGITLKLQSGDYGAGYSLTSLQATAEQPVIIEAANPADPPRFTGGNAALHLQGCAHITLRHLHLQGQKGNGLNIDDTGAPSHHITLQDLHVSDTGPTGNTDGIKLSGLTDFVVRHCHVTGWGGQAVDMVGCHRGLIVDCHIEGKPGYAQATGLQAKGGSEDITIRTCTLISAGQRPVNLGGSTGRPYFRPKDALYEARRITVEGCLFIGGMAPVAFVGVDTGVVRYCTFVNPEMWALRILQENREPGMIPCANGRFEHNVIAITTGALRTWINTSPGTQPETFTFAHNWWYHHGATQSAKPNLPAPETDGAYGTDPQLDPAANYKPRLPAAQSAGHTAFTIPTKTEN